MPELNYCSKKILVGDAILRLKRAAREDRAGKVHCHVCQELCDDYKQKVNVQGERIEVQQVLCENCLDNIRYTIGDMEQELEEKGHYA